MKKITAEEHLKASKLLSKQAASKKLNFKERNIMNMYNKKKKAK